jgi:hypothetical protein
VKFERFLQVRKSFFFALPLAGNVDFEALRNIPIPFTPDGSGESSDHNYILSYPMQNKGWKVSTQISDTTKGNNILDIP